MIPETVLHYTVTNSNYNSYITQRWTKYSNHPYSETETSTKVVVGFCQDATEAL
uniref:Uncharacterized protein n=1 Tax=Rhizophora mucronata TaxID=61149 RepID=A0A2P2IXR4_RHIMU